TLTEIGDNAFMYCYYLESLTFGESNTPLQIGINAFSFCRSLRELVLPDRLTAISNSCFASCDALEQIDLGGVRTVGKNAFRGCAALKGASAREGITLADGNQRLAESLQQ
ncbi:MAG: leucine-rich repeat domain-containing protein, partial [Clostridia bacterium]|nr:leucine-rich repeat domain-containing protein [Clostridia bacterium]